MENDKSSLLQSVRRWGGAASEAVLDPLCSTFSTESVEGFIAYRHLPHHAVVIGDPLCDPKDYVSLANAFHQYCQNKNKAIIYILASKRFADVLKEQISISIEFGEELFLHPLQEEPLADSHGRLLRGKVKHAEREQVQVFEYVNENDELRREIEQIGEKWLKRRHGFQVFISHINLFSNCKGKRWFYASHGNRVVGVLMLSHLQARNGWLLDRVMINDTAPNGTPELMICSAIKALQQEKCDYISLGFVPRHHFGEIKRLSSMKLWMMRQFFNLLKRVLPIGTLRKFWEKFNPQSSPSYILFTKPSSVGLRDVQAILRALNFTFKW